MMKRFITSLVMVAMTVSVIGAPTVAIAQSFTGPWTWTDLSSQLTPRTNRPVWTVAYANGNWFYADGLDLWNSGQVYRYDGFTQTNITVDLRNAGLNRVDDIVSDGQTVLFLQDVVAFNNNLRVVAYKNGQYLNITQGVRNVLNSNEGVSSISGRNGVWVVLTTQKRLFRWDATYGNPSQVTLPSVADNIETDGPMLRYNVNHGSANDGTGRLPLAIVPIQNNNWLFMADPLNGPVRFYLYNGSSFSDISNQFPTMDRVAKIVSNGDSALIYAFGPNGPLTRLTNGNGIVEVQLPLDTFLGWSGFPRAEDLRVFWNGKSWFILHSKQLFRVNGSFVNQTAENYGRVSDLFLQGAGDANGRLLLGGALSDTSSNNPSFPLTAKLVMVTEGVAAPRVLGVSDSVGGSIAPPVVPIPSPANNAGSNWTWLEPNTTTLFVNQLVSWNVGAWDPDGIRKVEIVVNGSVRRTCETGNPATQNCSVTLYANDYAQGTSVFVNAKITDSRGTETWTNSTTLFRANDGTGQNNPPSNTGANPTVWTSFSIGNNSLFANQSVTFSGNAWDNDGIRKIEIFVNGAVKRTCDYGNSSGNQTCAVTLFANDYAVGTNIRVNARATDAFGNISWSEMTTFFRANDGSTNNPPSGSSKQDPSVWEWLQPHTTAIARNGSTDYTLGAWDEDGIRSIRIVVNGNTWKTCDFNPGFGSQECRITLKGSAFNRNTDVFVNAVAKDAFGRETWSGGKTFHVNAN